MPFSHSSLIIYINCSVAAVNGNTSVAIKQSAMESSAWSSSHQSCCCRKDIEENFSSIVYLRRVKAFIVDEACENVTN